MHCSGAGFALSMADLSAVQSAFGGTIAQPGRSVLPGDLAVTRSGVHIMAYLGNKRWIEADPAAGSVITITAPSANNSWFHTPMNIVRWGILQ
jgi:hypothetical protein